MKNGIKKFKSTSNFLNNSGFTLVELLLVIVIIAFLALASFAALNRFSRSQNLNIAYEDMRTNLNFAKSSALSQVVKKCQTTAPDDPSTTADNFEFQGYMVTFTTTSYTIEERCSQTITDPEVMQVTLPPDVTISATNPITFHPLSGGTDIASGGTRVITITSGTRSKRITVHSSGVIE